MNIDQFERRIATQWEPAYGKPANIEADFEYDFVLKNERDVLVQLFFPPWMPRAVAQDAFLTISGKLGVDHAQKMTELGVTECERIVIPPDHKVHIVKKLDEMGINGYTLEIGDSTVETIAGDISSQFVPKT